MSKGTGKLRLSLWAGAIFALALSGNGTEWLMPSRARESELARKVVKRSETICREFVPGVGQIRVTAQPGATSDSRGAAVRYWMVDCLDSSGTERGHMTWDSRAEKLHALSRATPSDSRHLARRLDRRQAVVLAAQTLRTLPVSIPADRWQLSSIELARTSWHVSCRSASRKAHIIIDARTGELLSLFSGPARRAVPL